MRFSLIFLGRLYSTVICVQELTADGRKVMTTNSVKAPNVLFQEMLATAGGKDSFCTREFTAEKMKCVCNVEEVVTTRWYTRQ